MNPIKMKKDKIKTAHWLLGQWEAQSDGTLTETWKKANDSTYNGQVYFMKGTDTIHEKILLQQVEDELSYNTTIKVKMTMNQYPLYLRIETKRNF
jgi:hypothetical protein